MPRKHHESNPIPAGFIKIEKLGEGSDSVVWAVKEKASGEELALKLAEEPDPAHRLQREFAILERFELPGIIKVVAFGEYRGREYFTMELVKGCPITDFMQERRNSEDFFSCFLSVFEKAATILSSLHREGIVHIDVKPANLLVREDGEPVLLDFGFSEDYLLSPTAEARGTTLAYAAPELFLGGEVTPSADIYSLGVISYEVLSGAMLGIEKSSRELVAYKLKTPPRFGKLDFQMPSGFEALIFRMLNSEPQLRPSADEIIAEIEWLTKGKKVEVRPSSLVPRLCFGGRDEEIERIEGYIFEEKRVVLLTGESGIGKTRTLRELRFRTLLHNKHTLLVEGRGAHFSLTEHLAASLGFKARRIEDKDSLRQTEKWVRFEEISQELDKGGFDAVFIDAPVDLTEEEGELLVYLSHSFDGKLGMLLAQVPTSIYTQAVTIRLTSLEYSKVLDMISKTFEDLDDQDKLADILVSVASGNPRRMNGLLNILQDEGWLTWKQGWVYEPGREEKGLGKKLEKWLGESIERLDKDSRLVLKLLSVMDTALPVEVLSQILGSGAQLVLQGLVNKGLIRSFLYRERPHYEFGNDIIRPYLLGKLDEAEKKTLSKKLAGQLEEFSLHLWGEVIADWDANYLAQIGLLYFRSNNKKKVSRYLVVAGIRLRIFGDSVNAKRLLEYALASEPEVKDKKAALLELGDLAHQEHDVSQAEKYFSQVLPLLEGNPEEKALVLLRIGLAYQRVQDLDRAVYFFDMSEECEPEASGPLKSKQLYARAWYALFTGKLDKARALFEESLECSASLIEQTRTYSGLGCAFLHKGVASEGLKYMKKAVELAEEFGNKVELGNMILMMIDVLICLGDYEEIERSLEKVLDIANETRSPALMVEVLSSKATFVSGLGQHRESLGLIRQAIQISEKLNDKYRLASLRWREGNYLVALGDWETAERKYVQVWFKSYKEMRTRNLKNFLLMDWAGLYRLKGWYFIARRMFQKAKWLVESGDYKRTSFLVEQNRCKIEIDAGNYAEASIYLDECKRLKTQDHASEVRVDLLEAQILLAQGKTVSALDLASSVVLSIKGVKSFGDMRVDALLTLGRALIASDKFEDGLARLREGLEVGKFQESPYEQGIALYYIAKALFEKKGCNEEAIAALEEAKSIFERLGAKADLEKIKELHLKNMTDGVESGQDPDRYMKDLGQVSQLIKDLRAKHIAEKQVRPGLPLQYLEGLKKVSELINYRLGEDNFMDDLLDIVLKLTLAQRGAVFIVQGDKLHPVASKKMDDVTSKDARLISQTVIQNIQKDLQPIYTADASQDDRFNRSQSILLNEIRSLLCIPLRTIHEKLIGTIYLDSHHSGLFDAENTLYFEALGNLLAASIDKSAEFKKLQEELIIARVRKNFEESGIVLGTSQTIKNLYSQLNEIAKSGANILLEGETGTGKGVLARMIHEKSLRKGREFCSINCGILPENIFESELFGAKKGAYTSADQDRIGILEAANGSTVFFDEITNTSLPMQAKLLEVIEEKVIRRIGESRKKTVDLRFIFATNRNLREEVKEKRFREDLYFRISTLTLILPSLRERKDDIPEFVDFFIEKFSSEFCKDVTGIDDDALNTLLDYPWPGNIRELRSVIERSVLLSQGRRITTGLLEQHFFPGYTSLMERSEVTESKTQKPNKMDDFNLEFAQKRFEEKMIREALTSHKTIDEAARALGISRTTLWRKMSSFNKNH
ncbi:sigma 54-interacting transcriptional regulator [candidate division WOR-3 bacterium]|nr:sigma 54-interacting transcriptional regulator [candidate division WOR-3 bacterium]